MPDFQAQMPRVDIVDDLPERFAAARRVTRGEEVLREEHPDPPGQHCIVVITPGRMLMKQDCPPPGSMPPDMIAAIEQIVPISPSLNVTVIALNLIPSLLTDFSKTIPFFGYLLGLGYMGHNITIFEGHSSALAAGCADADLIIVDGDMIPHLQADWRKVAFDQGTAQRLMIFHRNGQVEAFEKKK